MNTEKEKIRIIIVEDDESQKNMYQDCIDEFNLSDETLEIEAYKLSDDKEVPSILYDKRIDAIVVDLDWGKGSQENEGNRLVRKLYKDCRVPIFIVSGNLNLLNDEYEESPILKKYQRDTIIFGDLLEEISNLYKTGYTKALGSQSMIDQMLSKVFWNHMSSVISNWENQDGDIQMKRMLRFAVTRVNEMLTVTTQDNHDEYDALEFYIKPPIKDRPFTGDIISYGDKKYVVITAACDMEQGNSEFVVLCGVNYSIIESLNTRIRSVSNSAEKEMERYINNGKSRYHLLPPCTLFHGGLVDFQMVQSISTEDFNENASVVASINPVFHKDIQARFSHYYGRQGQPQLSKDNIIEWIKAN
ncbi:hypothetical protein [Robinsoniella peoriensis]|uniref:hypothetical protein n=1 Tax=Robinsoniella peoriensis TaxID=180332 RepID=UPI00362F416A